MTGARTRREREREARRRHMLRAARAVIAERGFKRATIDEIAQRSEFGKGTIYNYFPDGKDEILFAIIGEVYDELHQISIEAFDPSNNRSFRHSLERYIRAHFEYFIEEDELFVILMKEANRIMFGDDRSKAEYFRGQCKRMKEVLESQVEAAIASGELKPLGAHAVAHIIIGNMDGYLLYHHFKRVGMGDDRRTEPASAEKAAQFMSSILLDGLAEPEYQSVINTNV